MRRSNRTGCRWAVLLCLLTLAAASTQGGEDDGLERARSLLEESRYPAARNAALDYVEVHPRSEHGYFIAGVASLALGDLKSAERHLRAADRRAHGMPELEYHLGELARLLSLEYTQKGREKIAGSLAREAVEHYEAELSRAPDHAGALAGRARILADRGEREKAIEAYENWIGASPDNPEAYLALARLYADFDRPQDALSALRRVPPGNGEGAVPTRYAVARSLFETGDAAPAIELLRQIEAAAPGSWRVAGLEALEAIRASRPFRAEDALAGFLSGDAPPSEVERIVEAYYRSYVDLVRAERGAGPEAKAKLPELTLSVVPKYPVDARTYGVDGKVLLLARVGVDGVPDPVTVVSCTVSKRPKIYRRLFSESAVEAVGQWRYAPAVRGGAPVAYTVPVRLSFSRD